MDQTLETLKKARDEVAKPNGWCRHTYHIVTYIDMTRYEQYCALGAIAHAQNVQILEAGFRNLWTMEKTPRLRLAQAIKLKYGLNCSDDDVNIAHWNDSEYTTQEEVVKVFDLAIKLEEEREQHAQDHA